MNETVCFSGHRFLSKEETAYLSDALDVTLEELIRKGAVSFRCGGAIGFDTLAAEAVLRAKSRHPNVRLELILPCPEQDKLWRTKEREQYRKILSLADETIYVSPSYFSGVLQMRNRRLVEGADCCVAFLKNSRGGGTAFTCAHALSLGLEFYNLAKESAEAFPEGD